MRLAALAAVLALAPMGCTGEREQNAAEPDLEEETPAMPDIASNSGSADNAGVPGDPDRPVLVGEEGPGTNICGSVGQVRPDAPIKPLVVRAAPASGAREVARVEPGQMVAICDYADELNWSGIVFDPLRPDEQPCVEGSPIAPSKPYRGPCSSGWIQSDNLDVIAG